MNTLPSPGSKTELLARARHEARMSIGRAAFVRDARVLPIGVPAALGIAALVYSRGVRRRSWRDLRIGAPRQTRAAALGAAAAALLGTVAVAYVGARVEWEVRRRVRR